MDIRAGQDTGYRYVVRANESPQHPKVVFPLHGIMTRANWQRAFTEVAQDRGWKCRLKKWSFGRVSLLGFLWPFGKAAKLRWFRDTYNDEVNTVGLDLDEHQLPSVVAHSFGTYIVGYAMLKYEFLRFNKIILCGSILPPSFPWQKLLDRGQVRALRNEYGVKDIWVKMVKHFVAGTGPSGATGFEAKHHRLEQKLFAGYQHSEYFSDGHMKEFWMPFLERKDPVVPVEMVEPIRFTMRRPTVLFVIAVACILTFTLSASLPRYALSRLAASINRYLGHDSSPTPSPTATPSRPPFTSSIGLKLNWVEPLGVWIGQYEVTQAEMLAVMGEVPGYYKGDRRPADRVTLPVAAEFCRRLTLRDRTAGILPPGHAYRLPNDREYDVYVADARLDNSITSEKLKRGKTEDVGSSQPNRFGLYDVRGNVWEWMSEGVLRGACWDNYDAQSLGLEYRLNPNPQYHGENFGFRCVLGPTSG